MGNPVKSVTNALTGSVLGPLGGLLGGSSGSSIGNNIAGSLIGGTLMGPIGSLTGAINPSLSGVTGGLAGNNGVLGGLGGNNSSTANTNTDQSYNNTSTTSTNPLTQPYLQSFLQGANNQVMNPDGTLKDPNSVVAPLNQNQNQAIGMVQNQAGQNNPLIGAGNQSMLDTVNGKYLDPNTNPYLQSTINSALGAVRGSLGSTFSGQNFGSSAHEQLMNQQSMAAIAPYLLGQYNTERANQMNATSQVPTYATNAANYGYNNANQLMNAGNIQQQQQQNVLNAPYQQLGLLQSAVGTGLGAGSTTANSGTSKGFQSAPNPFQVNPFANILGGAALGAGMGGGIPGAIVGGGVGLLSNLF